MKSAISIIGLGFRVGVISVMLVMKNLLISIIPLLNKGYYFSLKGNRYEENRNLYFCNLLFVFLIWLYV